MAFTTLKTERWAIDRLIPYARNARTHSNQQIAQIAASIAEFGFNNPVLTDQDGGIIAGHGRLLAARKIGDRSFTSDPISSSTAATSGDSERTSRLDDPSIGS